LAVDKYPKAATSEVFLAPFLDRSEVPPFNTFYRAPNEVVPPEGMNFVALT